MNNFTIEGILISKGELETFNNFKKRYFVIEVEDKTYKEQPEFVLFNEKAEVFNFSLGSLVEVHFGLAGRSIKKKDGSGEFQKTELKAWKVVAKEDSNHQTYAPKEYPKGTVDATISDISELGDFSQEESDQLPF